MQNIYSVYRKEAEEHWSKTNTAVTQLYRHNTQEYIGVCIFIATVVNLCLSVVRAALNERGISVL